MKLDETKPVSSKLSLLASSQVRRDVVKIDGHSHIVQEVGSVEFGDYGNMLKTDRMKATAYLLSQCLINEDGSKLLTSEEAETIAMSARVSMPLINKIMRLSGFRDDDEKKSDAG